VAKLLRVSHNRVREMIRSGLLGAVNVAKAGKKPRFVVWPAHLADYEKAHAAKTARPSRPSKIKQTDLVDFYPD
jgi:hypothetical protein